MKLASLKVLFEPFNRADINGRFLSLRTLMRMKEQAGCNKDLDNTQHLRWIPDEQIRHD